MNSYPKHIFLIICVLSVITLVFQSTIITLCKDSKIFKTQNSCNNSLTEEEEETHQEKEFGNSILFLEHDSVFSIHAFVSSIAWPVYAMGCFSSIREILVPPPKK